MIERQGRVRPRSMSACLAVPLRLRLAALSAEIAAGTVMLARVGLVALAIGLQTLVLMSPGHFRPAPNALLAIFVALGTVLSLGIAAVATLPAVRHVPWQVRRAIGVAGLLVLAIGSVSGIQRGSSGVTAFISSQAYNNDGAVMDLYAAEQVLAGHNPYRRANIIQALANMDAPATTTTPLMDGQFRGATAYPSAGAIQQAFMNDLRHPLRRGVPIPPEFESKYNYPAGSFLFIVPFTAFGIDDLRFLYGIFLALIGVVLWRQMPPAFRPLVPLLILADVPLMALTAGGQPDTMYGLFLLLALTEWASGWKSPLALGLAVATKQLAWFFLPFYLVLVFREFGLREALRRAGLVSAVFLLTNVPFILLSPGSYIAGLTGPMADPMFPLGIGAIALFVSNTLPMPSKTAFTVVEMAVWAGGIAAFARWRVLPIATIAILGALPLFFAWRSLVNYFYLVPLIALALLLSERSQRQRVAART